MALIPTDVSVIQNDVTSFIGKLNTIKTLCESGRANTVLSEMMDVYKVCYVARQELLALEVKYTVTILLDHATNNTNTDYTLSTTEYNQLVQVDLLALLNGIEAASAQFGIDSFSGGQVNYGAFNPGQTSNFQGLLDDVLANFL